MYGHSLEMQELCVWKSDAIIVQEFSPLSARLEKEGSELLPELSLLKEKLCEVDFAKYIENLISLKKSGDTLLLITQRSMERTILAYKFTQELKEAFAVKNIRIISQK